MNKLEINQDTTKWEKSKKKIEQLLKEDDISTITMMEFYKLYIQSPYDQVVSSLFELSFDSWYKQNMKGV